MSGGSGLRCKNDFIALFGLTIAAMSLLIFCGQAMAVDPDAYEFDDTVGSASMISLGEIMTR